MAGVDRVECVGLGGGLLRRERAEQSHESIRVREWGMRKFKSPGQAQRFLGAHTAVQNLFDLGRHPVSANHYRGLRGSAFTEWETAVA